MKFPELHVLPRAARLTNRLRQRVDLIVVSTRR
jgi:hypothetical protein